MSFNWWFTAPIDAINAIGAAVSDLPSAMFGFLINLITVLLYPLAFIIWINQQLFTLLYNFFVPIVNLNIAIANIPLMILQIFYAVPTPWTAILEMSIALSMGIRLYRWAKELKSWIPTMSGDN